MIQHFSSSIHCVSHSLHCLLQHYFHALDCKDHLRRLTFYYVQPSPPILLHGVRKKDQPQHQHYIPGPFHQKQANPRTGNKEHIRQQAKYLLDQHRY